MEFMEAIQRRHSVRAYQQTPVPEEAIADMLEAARLAPSGGNGQRHRFGVIDDPTIIHQLAEAAGNQMWIASAPLVIACCADIGWDIGAVPADDFGLIVNITRFGSGLIDYLNAYPDRRAICKLLENATPLIPTEHIFLAAVAHGLQACFVGYLDVDHAGRILGLPDHLVCLYLLPIGYPADDNVPPDKLIIEEISFRNCWPG